MNEPSKPLKIVLVCHSDLLGGAGVVTWRLMHALRAEGVDARMIVCTRLGDPQWVSRPGSRFSRGARFAAERLELLLHNGFDRENLFKVSIADTGMSLWRHPWIQQADIVNLNWINQGLLSLGGIRRIAALGKPIVWTMHDMWCMTGICHHAYECDRYTAECGLCPFLHSHSPRDLSHTVWRRKKKLYDSLPRMRFVAVSSWLARRAAASTLLGSRNVEVIPNAFPVESFMTEPLKDFPTFDPIPGRRRIIFGAARLDDPIKGLDILIEALNILFDERPDIGADTGIILFGDIRNESMLDTLRFPIMKMGRVNDPKLLRQLYASSKVVVSTSLYETLPGTLIEGQAAGCVPVSFGRGGQSDIIDHKVNGYIARYRDPRDIARGIMWALGTQISRTELHEGVRKRFAADTVARRYIALYRSLLENQPQN